MAYIGASLDEVEKTVSTINVACDTMTGNNSTATLTLSASQGVPESVNNISVYFDGVMQRPTNDYTLNYKTVTFTTAPETGVKVTVLSYANEFLNIVSDKTVYGSNIADGAVTAAKQTGVSFGNSDISGTMDASKLTGALPALDGSNVTGLASGQPVVINAADPTVTANPTNGVGTIWLNSTTGESYCCTDATAGDNVWTNIGSGTGSIALPTNPTNAGSFVTPMTESTTYNYIFSGALDNASTPAGTVTHYMVDNISNGALTVAAAEVAAGQPHVFTAAAVVSNTAIVFRVRAKDNDGHYSSGVTVSMTVQNDAPPGEINNGGAFADIQESSSQNYTFAGATDDFGVTHYLVDQISNAALTVSSAEVASGSAHTFNTGAVGSDTAVTFRVRAKDTVGQYSAGVTVTMTVTNINHIQVTSNVTPAVSGDYHVYTFGTSGGNFNVTSVPASGPNTGVKYLVVGGGGSGANHDGAGSAGGGGGGMRFNNAYDHTVSVQNYSITVGAGGNAGTSPAETGYKGGNSSFSTISATGGGGGARPTYIGGTIAAQSNGGSGGGGGWTGGAGGVGNQGGYSPSEGNNGKIGCPGGSHGGSGSQAGGAGHGSEAPWAGTSAAAGGAGGAGTSNDITGASLFYAGGGGGGCNNPSGVGGAGGSGVGGQGHVPLNNIPAESGMNGRGGGGGGIGWPRQGFFAGDGGDGVVIIRVKFRN